MLTRARNYIDGKWIDSKAGEWQDVVNPATGETLGSVPLSPAGEVDEAARAASIAWTTWMAIPACERIQYLFKLKQLMEEHFEELSRLVTLENGKTLAESKGELRRAIENVEVACGIPILMQGEFSEDIAPGIDEFVIRQPIGVAAIIAPFNFPAMIPFWFLPYALATGNTIIVKPSERCPLTMQRTFELFDGLGLPKGVINMVNGGAGTTDAILDHPAIRAISFVGSTPVARHIYARSSANGKRVQAQGGAKNAIVVLPDADMETTKRIIADSAFGNAGQRCLAASLIITVGGAAETFIEAIKAEASNRVVGFGLEPEVTMGPVITPQSKARIESFIQKGLEEGGKVVLDGRGTTVEGFEKGNFLKPTILRGIHPKSSVARTEVFGPLLGVIEAGSAEDAIRIVNEAEYGNMACIFTASGTEARKFRNQAQAGNIGVNIGVAAPMAFFPFSGWKDSFFGTLHGQSRHAVEFFTQTKVVVERWPKEWSRKF